MKINILDLEMNQASGNIIEIGAVCYDVKLGDRTASFQNYVKLPEGEVLNPDITALTGITEENLANAPSLKDALELYWAWAVKSGCCKFIAAWGNDYWVVIEESKALGVEYPSRMSTLNIKVMANIMRCAYPNTKATGGLANTLETFGLSFAGSQHRALVDAYNTQNVVKFLFENFRLGLDVTALVEEKYL